MPRRRRRTRRSALRSSGPSSRTCWSSNRALQRKLEKVVAIIDVYQDQLRTARRDVQQLRNLFLPICMFCKRVRDDDAYWHKIESYFARHAAVNFSHGICPTCHLDGRASSDSVVRG